MTFTDYPGLQHTITAPAGAVTDTIDLRYYPLVANSQPLPNDNLYPVNAFRLNALLDGVPGQGFTFAEPITIIVRYDLDALVYHVIESSLMLYAWDTASSAWIDATETCPIADRYKYLDTTNHLYEVHVCHLSEFGFFGTGGRNIRMGVNYGLNEAAGMYAVGHTFWITVTDSTGNAESRGNCDHGGWRGWYWHWP